MEEFLLRIGLNASALKEELGRVGAYTKAWATTLADDFKSKMGRMFAAGFLLDKGMEFMRSTLEKIQERVLAIKRAQGELPGVASAFVQNTFNYLERIGLSFESAARPLLKFKQLLGAARLNPGGDEVKLLERFNIITGEADLKTQKFSTSLAKLSEAYLKSGKNLAVLKALMGKESLDPALLAILELGPERIEKMNRFSFFSDYSPNVVNLTAGLIGARKSLSQAIPATLANLAEKVLPNLARELPVIGPLMDDLKTFLQTKGMIGELEEQEIDRFAESMEQEKKKVDITNKLLDLKQKEHELQSAIDDRGKASVDQMEAQARRITGITAPQLYGMTPRLRTSLNIKTLEERATVAFEQGNDALSNQLMAQAQQIRAANPWLMDKDRDPLAKANTELEMIRNELKPVSDMAEMVNKQSKK
jgi:hypothetical protein